MENVKMSTIEVFGVKSSLGIAIDAMITNKIMYGKTVRTRKRSRVEDCVDIEEVNETLKILLKTTNELNQKDQLLEENHCLKIEMAELKKAQIKNSAAPITPSPSYASVAGKQLKSN